MAAQPRILIVDDEDYIRKYLSLTFERAGYTVITARNALEAIELCADEVFDVLLSDVRMPEMDGHQLVQWIAVHRPATRTVLMSGCDTARPQRPTTRACPIIAKPFLPKQIVSFVDQVLTKE